MNFREEFEGLRQEHELSQQSIHLDSIDDALDYLHRLTPIEQFLRDRCQSEDENDSLWNFAAYYYENHRFNFQYRTANISVARHFRYDRHKMHSHSFFQCCYSVAGESELELESTKMLLREGDFMLLGPETPHKLHAFSDDTVLIKYYIRKSTFEKTFFDWLGEKNPLSDFFRNALYDGETESFILFHTAGDEILKNTALMLYIEMMNAEPYYNIIGEAKLTEIFCRLVRSHIEDSLTSRDSKRGTSLGRVISYIQENYSTATLDETARVSGYSKNYLCRVILRATGRTFTDLLNEIRIDAAVKLLHTTELPINEIGAKVGYNSNEHFHRTFKSLKGITPKQCRKADGYLGDA